MLKTYFIIPSTEYKPDDYIKLGQVITHPMKPFVPLAKPLPLDGALAPRISQVREWTGESTKEDNASIGLFSRFLSIMKNEASVTKTKHEHQTWKIAVLETQCFEVSVDPSYITRTSKIPEVVDWLRNIGWYGKPLYMVTGLKIAQGRSVRTYNLDTGGDQKANFQATVSSLPGGDFGAGVQATRGSNSQMAHSSESDEAYVFAYRLGKLKVTWKQQLSSHVEDYAPQADLHGESEVNMRRSTAAHGKEMLEIERAEVKDHDFNSFLSARFERFKAIDEDDGKQCLVIIPEA
ncbi:unnamed protein product [Parascedosporium putredinis]|uniref:Uncharacterized protein n=1 Tax=Parascedosporium putredinis TaxID=1442378 RepID=A0A9P1H0H4_9PEZI|nr:unnamed protein product [Parascedosporium putredinis]CAI7991774.1 unnamed protein product [Parascedosporium putredinis]